MSIKIKDLALGKGITNEPNDQGRLAECINLIPQNGALRKRGGFFSPIAFCDESHKPKRINGLFGFGEKILVHAGTELFVCPRDLSSFERLSVTLTDNKTAGIVANSMLYIVGGGDLYVYTGKEIFPIKKLPTIYAPTTRINVLDQYGNNKYEAKESLSLLTPRRVNMLIGTTSYRNNQEKPTFLLDGEILKGSALEIEVRIRLSITGLPEEAYSSMLKGVDKDGLESGEIVTIKYRASSIYGEFAMFPCEPIVDDFGNVINIRGEDGEPLEYDKIPLGVSVKKDRITFGYDIPTFEEGVSNIKVSYEVQNQIDIKDATTCSLCPRGSGSSAIAFSLGDNRLYYSDTVKGGDYVPTSNLICVGTGGEKITSLLEMSNGVLGVFTDLGFYKVTLYSDGGSYQVLNSADKIGSTSCLVNTTIAGDTLTFNGSGVFGTHTSSPYMEQIGYFYQRGSKISHLLKEIDNKKEAVAVSFEGKYFLFVGDKTLVADTTQRFTPENGSSGAYQYEWYQWQGAEARYALSYGGALYIGKENGRVAYLTSEQYDKDLTEFSSEKMTLFLTPQQGHTGITMDTGSKKSKGNKAILSSHERLASNSVTYENGKYTLPIEDFYTHDGGVALYEGQEIALYDYGNREIFKGKLGRVDPYERAIELDALPFEGAVFPLSLYLARENYEYDLGEIGLHYGLFENGRAVRVRAENPVLTVIEERVVKSSLTTVPINLGNDISSQNLIGAYLRVTEDTRGGLLYAWESDKHKGSASLTLSKQIHFDRFDLSRLCLYDSFKRDYYVPTLERNVKYVTLTLKSTTPDHFGITGLGIKLFEYEE